MGVILGNVLTGNQDKDTLAPSNSVPGPEELEFYQHPKDERVVVAPDIRIFKAAAVNDKYQGVILEANPDESASLKKEMISILPLMEHDRKVLRSIQGEEVVIPEIFESIGDRLRFMFCMLHLLSGKHDIGLMIQRGRAHAQYMHPHLYKVLNTNIGKEGTLWLNPENEVLAVPDCGLFFFKEMFMHASSTNGVHENSATIVLHPF